MRHVDWLVPSLLARGAGTLMFGQPGVGKSLHALHLAACLCLGRAFLGFGSVDAPLRVLFLDFESGWQWNAEPIRAIFKGMGHPSIPEEFLYYSPFTEECHPLEEPAGTLVALEDLGPILEETVRSHRVDVVIADSLGQMMIGDTNSGQDVAIALRSALNPARAAEAAVLVLDHAAKAAIGGAGVPTPVGSQQKRAWARVTVAVESEEMDGRRCTRWSIDKSNAAHFDPFLTHMQFVHGSDGQLAAVHVHSVGSAGPRSPRKGAVRERVERTVLEHLANGPARRQELGRGSTFDQVMDELLKNGLIEQIGRGQYRLRRLLYHAVHLLRQVGAQHEANALAHSINVDS
ncbi:hypothetical protein HNR42_002852 [Deinobacterium chartae]|uniref:AAA domain-containing protein n=1 Tax=Deinobacterium chartae TaxID=521158 RepID=A0A841I0U6_9DEIO|nr:hypothetical protein [Deinobacterium chartae]